MSTKTDVEGLGGDDDNQQSTPPSKPRTPIDTVVSEGSPVASANSSGGASDRLEKSRTTQEITVIDTSGKISVVFEVAKSITFDKGTDTYA